MRRRSLLKIAHNWPTHMRPLSTRLPRFPHPLPIQLVHVAQWFHALSDIGRLVILEFLSQRDRFVSELRDVTGMPRATVIFHLKVLRESGVVREYRSGARKYYSIHAETLEDMVAVARTLGPRQHVGTCPLTCCR